MWNVLSLYPLFSASQTMFVNPANSSLFISFTFSANKSVSAINIKLDTSMSPHKCKLTILHLSSDTKLVIRRGTKVEKKRSFLY